MYVCARQGVCLSRTTDASIAWLDNLAERDERVNVVEGRSISSRRIGGEGVAVRYHLRVHVDRFRVVVQFESEKMNVIIQGLTLDGGILG